MRQSYKAFQFDSQLFHESAAAGYNVLNATLSNDFYMDCIRGPRTIVEDKIPGRDMPYFYIVDDEPLEFEVTFALATALTKTEIKTMVRKFFQPMLYKQLHFGDYDGASTITVTNYIGAGTTTVTATIASTSGYSIGDMITISGATGTEQSKLNGTWIISAIPTSTTFKFVVTSSVTAGTYSSNLGTTVRTYIRKTPFYKIIFHGETDFNFVGAGKNNSNVDTFLGYFTLQVRSDRAYGYNSISGDLTAGTASQITINNTGDLEFYPNIIFANASDTTNKIRLYNETNGSYISFTNLYSPETITINATLKTLSSTDNTPDTIYERWEKNDLYLSPGSNTIKFQYYSGGSWTNAYTLTTLSVTGEAPVYIYDTN